MRNRPAIVLILLAVIAVVLVQFLVAVRGDSSPPAPVAGTSTPAASQPAPAAPATQEWAPDYGGLTPEEFYARQDAAETAAELAERERNQGERPPAEFDGLEGVSPWGVYDELDPPPEEEPVQAEAPEQTEEPAQDDAELTEEERAAQEAVEEILNRE
ncbi:hypothetical protein [Yoonia sp.]|uniref:hypothetical protein n=1 Tax=Yoonia sp. TaxID=2212373 RepID=UPI002FD91D97